VDVKVKVPVLVVLPVPHPVDQPVVHHVRDVCTQHSTARHGAAGPKLISHASMLQQWDAVRVEAAMPATLLVWQPATRPA
jgi:hypothetical protein